MGRDYWVFFFFLIRRFYGQLGGILERPLGKGLSALENRWVPGIRKGVCWGRSGCRKSFGRGWTLEWV